MDGKKENRRIFKAKFLLIGLFFFFTSVAQENIPGEKISDAVNEEIKLHPEVPFELIEVETKKGIVILSGETNNLLSADIAENIALSVKGVKGVVNNIMVKPHFVLDSDLQGQIEEAFLNNPVTDSYEIDVAVKNGLVKLSGEVDSWQENVVAVKVVKGIRGVRKVDNNLIYNKKKDRLDNETERC